MKGRTFPCVLHSTIRPMIREPLRGALKINVIVQERDYLRLIFFHNHATSFGFSFEFCFRSFLWQPPGGAVCGGVAVAAMAAAAQRYRCAGACAGGCYQVVVAALLQSYELFWASASFFFLLDYFLYLFYFGKSAHVHTFLEWEEQCLHLVSSSAFARWGDWNTCNCGDSIGLTGWRECTCGGRSHPGGSGTDGGDGGDESAGRWGLGGVGEVG